MESVTVQNTTRTTADIAGEFWYQKFGDIVNINLSKALHKWSTCILCVCVCVWNYKQVVIQYIDKENNINSLLNSILDGNFHLRATPRSIIHHSKAKDPTTANISKSLLPKHSCWTCYHYIYYEKKHTQHVSFLFSFIPKHLWFSIWTIPPTQLDSNFIVIKIIILLNRFLYIFLSTKGIHLLTKENGLLCQPVELSSHLLHQTVDTECRWRQFNYAVPHVCILNIGPNGKVILAAIGDII